nr:core binding factor beta subunit isoform 7 [Danio rerio]
MPRVVPDQRSKFENGVCVIWRGWLDLHRLDGMGCLEYDDERAQLNHLITQEDPVASKIWD